MAFQDKQLNSITSQAPGEWNLKLHGFLEISKFHDFPVFPWPVRTVCTYVPGRLVLPVMQLLEEGQGESPLSKHLVSPAGSPHSSWHHPLLQKHFHQSMFLEAQPLLWLLLHCRKEGERMKTTRICTFFVLLPTALTYTYSEYCSLCDKTSGVPVI